MNHRFLLCTAAIFLAGIAVIPSQAQVPRADFAKAMAMIKEGMSAVQVEKALGKPDDIITQYDPGGPFSKDEQEWRYGTDGHLTFPTLGCVYIDKGKVRWLVGGQGTPPDPRVIGEGELRKLLPLIDQAGNDNPLDLIHAVNTLQPLGKEKALAVLGEYLRVASDIGIVEVSRIGALLTARLLFQVPPDPGYMPRLEAGAPQPAEPKDPKVLPLFPLVVIDDIPVNLVYGYAMGGEEDMQGELDYFRKNGKLRERPLHPGNDPLSLLARLDGTPQWLYGKPGGADYDMGAKFMASQLLALVDSVYYQQPGSHGTVFGGGHFDRQSWDRMAKVFAQLHVKWDPDRNLYTYADGTTLPEVRRMVYPRTIWELPLLGPNARLILERENAQEIRAIISNPFGEGKQAMTLRIYHPWNKRHPLAQFDEPGPGGRYSQESTEEIELEPGNLIQAEAVSNGKTAISPEFKP